MNHCRHPSQTRHPRPLNNFKQAWAGLQAHAWSGDAVRAYGEQASYICPFGGLMLHVGRAFIIEFRAYERFVYHRGAMERTLYSMQHSGKTVSLILGFLQPEYDPKTEPWYGLAQGGNPYVQVLYSEELLDGSADQRLP